ncbi:hypothetical protein HMPREF0322_04253 [Desulfitobacterium hafniense DP7]|uniref:Uncharacterized protein n=1 Tax=Desulfitobacterium hafniense DP7 TaxID=537010 RepID=G9XTE6_DESHA|nr:hypothetical protein HMPREF0322_04253 [Desulfitobacterium hafniense DP7]
MIALNEKSSLSLKGYLTNLFLLNKDQGYFFRNLRYISDILA